MLGLSGFAVFATIGLILPNHASGQIIADFSGGGSTVAPVTNQVDAWTGMEGEGWQTAWSTSGNPTAVRNAQVLSEAPLTSGENYLQFSTANPDNVVRTGAIHRQYDGDSMGSQQTVSFQFRLDSAVSTFDRIRIFDGQSAALTEGTTNVSWLIRTQASTWRVYNGTTIVNTGMALVTGNVYDFNIHIVNDTYSVTINDLTAATSYSSGTLDFYTSSVTSVGGYLNFSLASAANSTAITSLSGIEIVPEPSVASVVVLGMFLLGGMRLWVNARNLTH